MKKTFLALALAAVIFSAASCGRDEADPVIFFNLFETGSNYICSIKEDGSDFKKIAGPFTAVTRPVGSSDGSRIAFSKIVTTMTQVWTMDTDGSDMRQETSPASGLHHYFPAWSADSRYIYYVQYDDSTGFNYSALYRLDVESGTVTANAGHSFYNGNSVACYENHIAYYDYGADYINVFDIRTNTDVLSTAASGLSYPTFFYDGRMACSSGSSIYIYQPDFSSHTTIDFSAQALTPASPAISPDGEKIVFVDSPTGSLYIYDTTKGGNAVLLKTGTCTTPGYMGKPR